MIRSDRLLLAVLAAFDAALRLVGPSEDAGKTSLSSDYGKER